MYYVRGHVLEQGHMNLKADSNQCQHFEILHLKNAKKKQITIGVYITINDTNVTTVEAIQFYLLNFGNADLKSKLFHMYNEKYKQDLS